jgi:predicted extracellular nuclease
MKRLLNHMIESDNMKYPIALFLAGLLLLTGCGDKKIGSTNQGDYKVMFYNVENLFDTFDDPEKRDEEYTPEGNRNWTNERYQKKLGNIARIIVGVGKMNPPAIVGLCEVENLKVLEDLTNYTGLKQIPYSIVHKESPDQRGIDVALIYRKDQVKPLSYRAIPVDLGNLSERPTRDILYFKGYLQGADTIHFFVNHWPSRYGGQQKSDPKRVKAAEVLKHVVDSILSIIPEANVILTGDFNDDPDNRSLSEILNAGTDPGSTLVNLSAQFKQPGKKGTLKYRGNWNVFDQFIVSGNLMDDQGKLKTGFTSSHIYYGDPGNEYLLEIDDRFQGLQPNRTYRGRTFHDGYSDHLPVYLELQVIQK